MSPGKELSPRPPYYRSTSAKISYNYTRFIQRFICDKRPTYCEHQLVESVLCGGSERKMVNVKLSR